MTQQIRQGALFLLLGEALLAIMAAMVRHLSDDLSTGQIVFFRNIAGLIALFPLLLHTGLAQLKTQHFTGHLNPQPGRRQCHVLLFLGPGPYAVNRSLSGETVGALIYATAGIVVAERSPAGRYSWLALLIGFGGVAVILLPQGSSERRRLAAACRINWSARCGTGRCRQGYHPQHVIDRIQPTHCVLFRCHLRHRLVARRAARLAARYPWPSGAGWHCWGDCQRRSAGLNQGVPDGTRPGKIGVYVYSAGDIRRPDGLVVLG